MKVQPIMLIPIDNDIIYNTETGGLIVRLRLETGTEVQFDQDAPPENTRVGGEIAVRAWDSLCAVAEDQAMILHGNAYAAPYGGTKRGY